jgi:hypothetical protein
MNFRPSALDGLSFKELLVRRMASREHVPEGGFGEHALRLIDQLLPLLDQSLPVAQRDGRIRIAVMRRVEGAPVL